MAKTKKPYSPDQGPLTNAMLKNRVDLARMVSYRYFFEVKSKDDFYLEDLLNSFIALVQQPISFAIYRKDDFQSKLCFHFCSDKEHRKWFEDELDEYPPKQIRTGGAHFNLFPELLDHEYSIVIFLMHTKVWLNRERSTQIKKTTKTIKPENREEYISICATRFFENPWDGFHSLFKKTAESAIRSSIERVEKNNRPIANNATAPNSEDSSNWPISHGEISKARGEIGRPNSNKEDWHNKVAQIFSRAIQTFDFGNQSISQLMHIDEEYADDQGPFPQNMMVMYRAFDREEKCLETGGLDKGRHDNQNGSYQYNVRFLLDEKSSNGGSIKEHLEELKLQFSDNPHSYQNEKNTRLLYRNILRDTAIDDDDDVKIREKKFKRGLLLAITQWMDVDFWHLLRSEGGINECLRRFKTPVGNNSRSFCDPVLQTGLIHFNSIFEKSGGLDRVDISSAEENSRAVIKLSKKFEKGKISPQEYIDSIAGNKDSAPPLLDAGLLNDLRRIVIFYYVFAGMASEVGMNSEKEKTYNPKNLTAILMPIKMRGAAWAVTVHATYMDVEKRKKSFQYLPFWMSNFLLMTSQRQRFSTIFDRVLWENIEHRVSDLLAKYIGIRDDADLDAALLNVNKALEGEQRLLPYVFPKFKTNTSPKTQVKQGQYIDLLPKEKQSRDRVFQIFWTTTTNPFYIPRQPWSGKPRRSFEQAVKLGVMYGLQQQALRSQTSQKKDK